MWRSSEVVVIDDGRDAYLIAIQLRQTWLQHCLRPGQQQVQPPTGCGQKTAARLRPAAPADPGPLRTGERKGPSARHQWDASPCHRRAQPDPPI